MAFFDIVGDEMLATIEQSITEGYVSKAYNATILTLIPKCDKPTSFVDFHPILVFHFATWSLRLSPR